jgi:tetratricopeptide (TPR) repeat protein
MQSRTWRAVVRVLVFSLVLAWGNRPAPAQEQAPSATVADTASSAEEQRERQAMERFLTLLEKAPRRGTALDRVHGYHVERGTLDSLLQTYRDRTTKDPNDGAAWLLLGLLESQRGRDAAAVAALRKAEKSRPDDALPSYYLGQALVLVGQPDAAAEAFERAIARKPPRADLLEIFQALGRVHQRAHHDEQALAVWARLEKLFPDDARVQEQIAAALAEESDPSKALPRYEALAKKATDPYRRVQLRLDAADLKIRLGRKDEALGDFEGLLGQLNSENWLYREVRRKVEEVFLRTDDQAGLAAYYEAWLKKNPDDVEAMARLGRVLATQGRVPEAQKWFDEAVRRAPSRKELRLALVEQLVQEKKFAEAAAQYEAMAKADPADPDLIREWGRMLLRDTSRPEPERKKSAAAVWRKLVERRPNDAAAAVQVADLLRQAEMPDEAIALYKKAIALAPESAQYREYLGEYYHALGRKAEALATWSEIAAGKNRNAKSLGRLAEVLAGFGYKAEALAAIADACKVEGDDFDLRFKYAVLLHQSDRFADALVQLDTAASLADGPEQADVVLEEQVRNYQASHALTARTEALREELDAGKDANAPRWRRLARLYEVDQKLPEATAAIRKALDLDPRLIPAWATAARIFEAAGNLGDAASAQRTLAGLDRRARAEHLKAVAQLEGRLGRREEALKAGRELLAASPGNPESYQFFADLCFQVGQTEEGLDALRRAVRANPGDGKAILALAETLAEQYRTDEAIELDWRAFEAARDLDGKLAVVSRLTTLYLQRNQFDRLIARLELQQREANGPRDLSLCLAQAYQASGDYGTARQVLEKLLVANPRDTGLLGQLSALAETEGDVAAAARFQRQLNEIAPSDEGKVRLALLHARAGELDEAEALWARLASGEHDPARTLQALDQLLAQSKPDTVLAITGRLLRKDPNNWEVLYREASALAASPDRIGEAAARFRALLDLPIPDDEPGLLTKARKNNPALGRPAGSPAQAQQGPVALSPPAARQQAVAQARQAAGLDFRFANFAGQAVPWSPTDFGQARMVAVASLLKLAQGDGKTDELLERMRAARARAPRDPKPWWEWYYLHLIRNDARQTHEAARDVAHAFPTVAAAQWAFLASLPSRGLAYRNPAWMRAPGLDDKTPPLPPDELESVLASYRTLRRQRPEWVEVDILTGVADELKRARRGEEADRLYREAVAGADRVDAINNTMQLAAERGDLEGCLALFDKYVRLQGNRTKPTVGGIADPLDAVSKVMLARSQAGAHADVVAVVDRYLAAMARREPGGPASRGRPALFTSPYGPQQSVYPIWTSQGQTNANLDFPRPNDDLDYGAITLLRNAFESYRRADLVSDLIGHFRAQVPRAEASGRIEPRLALGYLLWWDDDKDEAVATLTRAAELKGDPQLRLDLAELRERRGERDEALALADSVEPLDQKTMQRREQLALRLAVLTGDVDRARKAAERLFNLRLDTETQLGLSAQMHQLGMHELAEAVLGRARRRAGNRSATLVALMHQYQSQGKTDLAVQVAHEVLRKVPTRSANPFGGYGEDDAARQQATQMLARSGKLASLIDRAEAQLKASPGSIGLLQMLADYHRAAGDRAKARAVADRIIKARPDDVKLRYMVAQQLIADGDAPAAIEHYRVAIKKDMSQFAVRYWEVQNAFQQAGKLDELVQMVEQLDLRSMAGNSGMVLNLLQQLVQDEKTRDRGMALFRRCWKSFPDNRTYMIAILPEDTLRRMSEMYDYAKELIVPRPDAGAVPPWAGIDSVLGYTQDGRVNSAAVRVLDIAVGQNKLDALQADVERTLARRAEWEGGHGLLALIKARRGEVTAAAREVEDLLRKHKADPIPMIPSWILGLELENYGPTLDLARALYEATVLDPGSDLNQGRANFLYSPARRLVALDRRRGRPEAAYELVRRLAKRPDRRGAEPQLNFNQLNATAEQFFVLGYPIDAVRVYTGVLDDPETIRALPPNGEAWITQQVTGAVSRAAQQIDEKSLPSMLRALVKPADESKPGRPVLDLSVAVSGGDLDHVAVASLLDDLVEEAVTRPDLLAEARGELAKLSGRDPADLSVPIAVALVALAEGKPDAVDEALAALARRVEEVRLEDLPPAARANSRQRAEARKQLGLWLVARACWKLESARDAGDRLAERALEAARRQADNRWSQAMLREWGQAELDRGDRPAAERRWGRLLDLVLLDAKGKPVVGGATVATSVSSARVGRPAIKGAVRILPAGGASAFAPRVAALPFDRFQQAMLLARRALQARMPRLSIRAVRDSLSGGPPAGSTQERDALALTSTLTAPAAPGGLGFVSLDNAWQGQQPVDAILQALEPQWIKQGVPAVEVYETLRAAVLPDSRQAEIFLYARPLPQGGTAPRPASVSAMLARWAARADRLDDLRRRVESRRGQPMAEVPAMVLLAQIGMEAKDAVATAHAFEALRARLEKDTLRVNAELACLAALSALRGESAPAALAALEQAARNLKEQPAEEPAGSLLVALARDEFARGDAAAGRTHLEDYAALVERNSARQGQYAPYRRRMALQRIASEYVRAGLLDEALGAMGQFADTPITRFGDPGTGSVAAPLLRLLCARPLTERYEMLKAWTMPTDRRRSVRLLATALPIDTPPSAFGVTRVEPTSSGLASTAGLLIDAASRLGKLDELAAELERADGQKVENAAALRVLVEVARGRAAPVEPAAQGLRDELARRWPKDPSGPNPMGGAVPPKPIEWSDILVAEASLHHDALRPHGRAMLQAILDQARKTQNWNVQALASRLLAAGESAGPGREKSPELALWHPSSFSGAWAHAAGAPDWWTAQDGLVTHLAGSEEDFLDFACPLAGTFEFSVDAYSGPWAEAQVAYGGLTFEDSGASLNVVTIGRHEQQAKTNPAFRPGAFNRWTLRVEPGRVQLLINGHLVHDDPDPSPANPWLSLFTKRERPTAWRSPTLTGSPTIHSEVRLSHAERLEGWVAGYYNESMPARRVWVSAAARSSSATGRASAAKLRKVMANAGQRPEDFDWSSQDGVIVGRRIEDGSASDEATQSWLYHQRPLHDGETLACELFYEPGETQVALTLGRLAFLVEPGGVRLHWLTDGPDNDWTGLPPDNLADEPASRRGTGPLPLKPGEWNALTLSLEGGTAILTLNGVEVLRRPVEPDNNRHFGFFHFKDRASVRVRNVVLKGNWPKMLTAVLLANLLAPREDGAADVADRRVCSALIGEKFFSMQVDDVLRKGRALPPEKRYEVLARWVLPGAEHASFRLYGAATPTDAAPPVAARPVIDDPAARRIHTGGTLEFPAVELVAAAKEIGKLDDLAATVEKLEAKSDLDRRNRLAMLALVRMAQEKDDAAEPLLKELAPLLGKVADDAPEWERWPEVVAVYRAIARPKLRSAAMALIETMINQAQKKAPNPAWERRVKHVRSLAQVVSLPDAERTPFGSDPRSAEWKPVTIERADSRGLGDPIPHWTVCNAEAKHYPGHLQDFLYYNVPLRGNFEVNCELTSFGWRESRISYAGVMVGVVFDLKRYDLMHYGRGLPGGTIDPPLKDLKAYYPYRLVVKDGTYTAYADGRKIYEQRLPNEPDPWLAIQISANLLGGARNLKITGSPTIPDSLNLSALPDLTGWMAEYYGESVSGDNRAWEKRGEEIYGRCLIDESAATESFNRFGNQPPPKVTPGSKQESLLQYHRPMLEDGEIRYEFYFEPGKVMAHPVLDRCTFLLEPDGVKIHWLTDAQFDRTGLMPDNTTVEKENRKGPDQLALKPNDWNRVKLTLVGDKVTLDLNDATIYERTLEPTNQRVFGLFHYADETEVRVRNVVYKGNWPKKLPDVQELAGSAPSKPAAEAKP